MPSLGPFPHGVSWRDVPTSVIAPVAAYPGMNVVVGSAPLWMTPNGKQYLNVPRIYNNYQQAVAEQGYSIDWATYDICEHMDSVFVEFGVFPVTYIAVNDQFTGATAHPLSPFTLVNGQVDTGLQLINDSTLQVAGPTGTPIYVNGTDYLLSLAGPHATAPYYTWVVTRIATGAIPSNTSTIEVGGNIPSTTPVTAAIIVGGSEVTTGKNTGLQCVEDVFQKTGYVPGVIICPAWSHDPTVAAAMEAKCENINGCFACTCVIDVDMNAVHKAQDVLAWKNTNNIVFPRQELCFGMPTLVGLTGGPGTATTVTKKFHFASQQGPLLQWTDANKGGGIPYCSPSNKNLRMNSLQDGTGAEVTMHLADANMLNGQGVITALNFVGGWRSWGNRTSCYPFDTDVHDMFIPVRRMFDYIGNTVVLTIWQEVDEPGNRRLIDAIVNALQLWLDGLTATGALIGASIAFNQSENPTTEILNGHYVFHIYIAVPTPTEWLDFRIEYFLPFVNNLFTTTAAA